MIDAAKIKFLNNVPVQNSFGFSNGKSANSLEELYSVIKNSEDGIFYEHVNDQKNDFANWIKYCIFHIELSDRLFSVHKKDDFLNVLKQEIDAIRGDTVSQVTSAPIIHDVPIVPPVVPSASAVPFVSQSNPSEVSLQPSPTAPPVVTPVSPQIFSPVASSSQSSTLQSSPDVPPVPSSAPASSSSPVPSSPAQKPIDVATPASPSYVEEIFEFEAIFQNLMEDIEHEVLSWDEQSA